MKISEFLAHKPLYYKEFDPLRMQKAYSSIKDKIVLPKIVHIIGTNGKGSTGRYLAQMLHFAGKKVGHYTSPHILDFNERIWIDGVTIDDQSLQNAFESLLALLDKKWQDTLSYFEFTTLVAMLAFQTYDYVILEAGLGGEHDATSVFENILTLVTPIGLDHADFLGETLEEVALTKINAVQKVALSAQQEIPVWNVFSKSAAEKGFELLEQKTEDSDRPIVDAFAANGSANYLVCNYGLALNAFRYLGFRQNLEHFNAETLFGRLTAITPHITIDVGHNALAAQKILEHYRSRKVNLVYNTLSDKKFEEILQILKPIIAKVLVISIVSERALNEKILENCLDKLAIKHERFNKVEEGEDYLVFGSFVVVEAFLKGYR